MGGIIYAPCTNATLNSGTTLTPVSGNALSLITSNLYVTGGSTLTLSGGAAAASTQMMLSQ
jgi:hypothetical protein